MTEPTDSLIVGSAQGDEPAFPKLRLLGDRLLVSPAKLGDYIPGHALFAAKKYQPEQQIYFVMQLGEGVKDKEICVGKRVLIDQYKITSRVPAGPGLFIIDTEAVNILFP